MASDAIARRGRAGSPSAALEGEVGPFLPALHLGQWLHVGKETVFGMGQYRLEMA